MISTVSESESAKGSFHWQLLNVVAVVALLLLVIPSSELLKVVAELLNVVAQLLKVVAGITKSSSELLKVVANY